MITTGSSHLERFLRRLQMRSVLQEDAKQTILELPGRSVMFGAHHEIARPGERVRHASLVLEGLAAGFHPMKNGGRQFTGFYLPGDMCDLHTAVLPPSPTGIEALTNTTIFRVPHQALREAAAAHSSIAAAFWRDTGVDASLAAKWTANIGRRSARTRLAHLMCEIGMRVELAGLGDRTAYRLGATQTQLADAVGLTPVHVNRTLRDLRADHLLRISAGRVDIPDWERLASTAEFDCAYLHVADDRIAPADPPPPPPPLDY